MPTVLRQDGFEFRIHTDDHEPAHVHIFKVGGEVIVNLGDQTTPVSVRENFGMPKKEERKALVIAGDNQEYLLERWGGIHG